MQKYFDTWDDKKKMLEQEQKKYLFRTGDIWLRMFNITRFQRRFVSLDDGDFS